MTSSAEPRRVLHVLRTAGVSGAENHLALLTESLAAQGWASSVLICTPRPADLRGFARRLASSCERVTLVRMRFDLSLRILLRLAHVMTSGRYDLVHTHLVHADWHAGLVTLLTRRTPVLSTKHNPDPFRTRRTFRALEALWLRRCAGSIAISESLAGFIEHWSGIRPVVVPYGWPASAPTAKDADDPIRNLIAVGRLEPQKGFDVLIEAIALCHDRGHDVRLRIVGEGSQRGALEGLIRRHGLTDRVELVGQRPDVAALMQASDVFVHAARWEGFGIVLLEAMSAQLPIVATRVAAIPEIVLDGVTGLLVSPDDPEDLAGSLARLMQDPQLATTLGRAGNERLATEAAAYAAAIGGDGPHDDTQ